MGTLRVTQSILVERVLRNLNRQSVRILDLQTQLATGRRVNAPSDNPADARRAINTSTAIQRNEQFVDNISVANPLLRITTSMIQTVVDNLRRAYELTLQGANESNGPAQLEAIAVEINQLLEDVVLKANMEDNGRFIFAGTRTLSPAYVVTRDVNGDITNVTYQGNTESISIVIGEGVPLAINETGPDVFQAAEDIFQILIGIRDDLRAGDQASLQQTRIGQLETAEEQLLNALARIGAVQNRLERASDDLEDLIFQLQELLSDTVDADFADVILNLNAQSNAFQAALNAGSRVIQPSLLDFIR